MASDVEPPRTSDSNSEALLSDPTLLALSKAERMKRLLESKSAPLPLPKISPTVSLLKKIPFLTEFLRSVDHAGNSLSGIATLHGHVSNSLHIATSGFQWAGLPLLIIDFLRMPAMYLAAAIAGEKLPINLSVGARWLYSGLLLGLVITSFAVSALAAPIGLALASLGLGVSLFTMSKMLYERFQIQKKQGALKQEIASVTKELEDFYRHAQELEEQLRQAEAMEGNASNILALRAELDEVTKHFDQGFKRKNVLLQDMLQGEKELENMKIGAVIDKGIGVALSAVFLTGAILSLVFPPLGLLMIAGSAIAGGVYLLSRLVPKLISWFSSKFNDKKEPESLHDAENHQDVSHRPEHQDELIETESLTAQHARAGYSPSITSTALISQQLLGTQGAIVALHEQIEEDHAMDELQNRMSSLVMNHNQVLGFFRYVASSSTITTDKLKNCYDNLEPPQPQLFTWFRQTLSAVQTGEITLSEGDKNQLMAHTPLVEFLQERGIGLADSLQENRPISAEETLDAHDDPPAPNEPI